MATRKVKVPVSRHEPDAFAQVTRVLFEQQDRRLANLEQMHLSTQEKLGGQLEKMWKAIVEGQADVKAVIAAHAIEDQKAMSHIKQRVAWAIGAGSTGAAVITLLVRSLLS